jgi:beta-1,4-mannosyl-glycoprotein beta-1,4-N-acetylglucosaminyltransferase
MKIYDCFTFYNEFDLLELRLTELYNHVDHFVIVESNQTFTNRPKPWNFDANRYAKFMDKIIYVQVTDMPNSDNAWTNEHYQRDQIMRGLTGANPDDLVIISDVDEILRPEAIDYMRNSQEEMFAIRMALFNFKLNYMRTNAGKYDVWAMAAAKHLLDHIAPHGLRNIRHSFMNASGVVNGCEVIEHGGWHFGYVGNTEYLIDKAKSFSHTEVNNPEFLAQIDPTASIEKRTSWKQDSDERYEILEIDNYLPKSISQFAGLTLSNGTAKALDFLPAYTYNQ